jgi:putative addiction module component (TIGR02574 family)
MERAQLAEALHGGDERDGDEAAVEAAWAAEVERRIARLESGEVVGIPFGQAMAHIYAVLE